MEQVQYYVPTKESELLRDASELDPMGLTQYMGDLQIEIMRGNPSYLAEPLGNVVLLAHDQGFDHLTEAEATAMIRDFDFALSTTMRASALRGDRPMDIVEEWPEAGFVLRGLAERLGYGVNRGILASYLAQAPGFRSFTGTKSETNFLIGVQESYFASDYAFERLTGADFTHPDPADLLSRLNDAASAFKVLLLAHQFVFENMSQRIFAKEIQPCFQPIDGMNSQGASQSPLGAAEHILRGINLGKEKSGYWGLFNSARQYRTAKQREMLAGYINRNGMSYEEAILGDNSPFSIAARRELHAALDEVLNEIDDWRAQHLHMVGKSFKGYRDQDSVGSSGGDPKMLAEVHRDARLPGDRSNKPVHVQRVLSRYAVNGYENLGFNTLSIAA